VSGQLRREWISSWVAAPVTAWPNAHAFGYWILRSAEAARIFAALLLFGWRSANNWPYCWSMKLFLPLLCALTLATSASAAGTHVKGEKPLRISQGAEVNLADFLVPGKFTIFDFTSEYCPPCRGYTEPLYLLHQKRDTVAVVKVDINRSEIHKIDWDSPVARQYGMQSIPHFKIYGPDGKLIAEDTTGERRARVLVDKWINALN
jgi:thiol-disulfide isomerase/thioredoxin